MEFARNILCEDSKYKMAHFIRKKNYTNKRGVILCWLKCEIKKPYKQYGVYYYRGFLFVIPWQHYPPRFFGYNLSFFEFRVMSYEL